jgi:hypothetical protein
MQYKSRMNNLKDINTSNPANNNHNGKINIDNYFDSYPMPKTTKQSRMSNLFSPRQRREDNLSTTSKSDHFGGFSNHNKKGRTRFKDLPVEDRNKSR